MCVCIYTMIDGLYIIVRVDEISSDISQLVIIINPTWYHLLKSGPLVELLTIQQQHFLNACITC